MISQRNVAFTKLLQSLVKIEILPVELNSHEACFEYFKNMADELDHVIYEIENHRNSGHITSRFTTISNIFKNILRHYSRHGEKYLLTLERRVKIQLLDEMRRPENYPDITHESDLSGMEAYKNRLGIIELILFDIELELEVSEIIKEISFPPEYKQSGISILNYFSEVIDSKYPDIDISVTIKQGSNSVSMIITLPSGHEEVITKALEDYGNVVSGKLSVKEFLPNQIAAMSLQHKLEFTQMEVSHTRQMLEMERTNNNARVNSLEAEVARLFSIIDSGLSSKSAEVKMLISLLNKEKQLSSATVKSLIDGLVNAYTEKNDKKAIEIVKDIKTQSPSLYEKFNEVIVKGAISGVSGNFFYSWLCQLIKQTVD